LVGSRFANGFPIKRRINRQLPDERPIQAMAEIDNEPARKTISQWFRRMIGMSYRNDGNINRLEPLIDENINRLEALIASEQIDLVWSMVPWTEPLSVRYIASVWDLEHRKQPYFPEVSTTGWTWSARENVYNALLPRASMVITGTQAGKEEVLRYYHVNPANVMVIPFPAPDGALMIPSVDSAGIKAKCGLGGDFLLYPAQFWPHKNHINLLRALRTLRYQHDLDLSLRADWQRYREPGPRHETGRGTRPFGTGFFPRLRPARRS
jgi:hypothetical protein